MLDLIEKDGGKDAQIIFLGDYTDRGPDSRGVMDLLVEGQAKSRNWTLRATTTACSNGSCKSHCAMILI